jgi:hypothetical protein
LYRLITGQHSPPRYFPKYTSAVKAWFGVARRGTLSRGLAWQAWTAQETGPFSFALLGYANYYIAFFLPSWNLFVRFVPTDIVGLPRQQIPFSPD